MTQLYKFSSKIFFSGLLSLFLLCTVTWKTAAIEAPVKYFRSSLTAERDTVRPILRPGMIRDTVPRRPVNPVNPVNPVTDTSANRFADTLQPRIDTFSLKISKDSLEAPLRYSAEDSAVVLIQDKKIILYGKTKTEYKDITLTAPMVEVDQKEQTVTAVNKKDSTGAIIETAHFKSGENEFTSDTIRYNFKTQVGLTRNSFSMQGEYLVIAATAKKVNDNTTFAKDARFTTCLLDEPHFAIKTDKMKVISNKLAVSGPAHLEFEEVPIPVYLPFGYYPLSKGRRTGLLPPQFATNEQFGLGLEGLGFYKVINAYWDVKFYGNVYSYGGWSMNINPTYRRRYRYNGAFNLSIQRTKQNFRHDPDFIDRKTFHINWTHSVDAKARPGTSFTAMVNAGSTRFNQYVPNSPRLNFENQLGSNISYAKTWAGKPYSLTLSADHNQNNTTRLINVSLPNAGFMVNTVYPFQRKETFGSTRWFEKLGVGYSGNFRNQFSFYDTAFRFRQLIDTLQWGALHNFPITMALPPIFGGAIIISPNVSYSQVWIAQKFRRKWNRPANKVDTIITRGFFMDHQTSFGLGMNTAIYGTVRFNKSRISAIRHVIRPSLNFNYKPDLSRKHFYTDTVDATGYTLRFSEFDGALYPGFSEGKTGGISFSIDNNLEMKWRSRKDTVEKKIKLIDGFGFNTGYNFLRDSMKLDFLSLYLRTTLFEKISLTANGSINPYKTDARGNDIDKFAWSDGNFNIGRLTYASVALSTSFRSKPRDEKKETERKKQLDTKLEDPNLVADRMRLLDYVAQNPSQFVDFNIPWQVNLQFSLNYTTRLKPDYSGFIRDIRSNLNFNGSFNLTPKWNFSVDGFYDFDTRQLQTFHMGISRDMHCWQLSISVIPVGLYRSFSFSISPKASILQDLRINRTRSFSNF